MKKEEKSYTLDKIMWEMLKDKGEMRCVLHGFSVPMKVEEKWAFVSRLDKANKDLEDLLKA